MRDLTLSLLSRGCGLVARSHQDSQDGRLEVCFEPEVKKPHKCIFKLFLRSSGTYCNVDDPDHLFQSRTTTYGNPISLSSGCPIAGAFWGGRNQCLLRPTAPGEDLSSCTLRTWLPWQLACQRPAGRGRSPNSPDRKWIFTCTLYGTWLGPYCLTEKSG